MKLSVDKGVRSTANYVTRACPDEVEFVPSQNGEDGILHYIFRSRHDKQAVCRDASRTALNVTLPTSLSTTGGLGYSSMAMPKTRLWSSVLRTAP